MELTKEFIKSQLDQIERRLDKIFLLTTQLAAKVKADPSKVSLDTYKFIAAEDTLRNIRIKKEVLQEYLQVLTDSVEVNKKDEMVSFDENDEPVFNNLSFVENAINAKNNGNKG